MQMMMIVRLALVILVLMPIWSFGDATVYTDRASFEAAIGPHVTYTFDTADGFPAAPASISSFGPVIATGSFAGDPAYIRNFPTGTSNQTLSGVLENGGIPTDSLYISFTEPEYAIGFDFFAHGPPGYVGVTYSGSGGTYSQSYPLISDGLVDNSSIFFGLTSSDLILRFSVQSTNARGNAYTGIDNFTMVPEPSGAALLLPLSAALFVKNRSSQN